MKHITAQRYNDIDWGMRFLDKSEYDVCFDEDVFVTKEDGSPLCVLLKNRIPLETIALAWSVLERRFNPVTENRSTATGIESRPREKMDGTMSKVMRVPLGWEVVSGIVGYFERTVRFPYAHACSWNEKYPEKFKRLIPLAEAVNAVYRDTLPERWKTQKQFTEKTKGHWLIGDTVFSTLTINKNFRTACHKDAGDLPQGFGCLSVIEKGKYLGAELIFPNYRVAVNVRMGDVLLFDPHEWHGNTQIVPVSPKAQRCSIVYYFREKLQYCKSPAEELDYVKNRKLGDRLFPELNE